MQKTLELKLTPAEAADKNKFTQISAKKLGISVSEISQILIQKKSIDARSRSQIWVNLTVLVLIGEQIENDLSKKYNFQDVSKSPKVVIVGAGPAGLFAALKAIELNLKPIVIERGKTVEDRKKDIAQLNRGISLNEDSNYCFGEGGAGTYSDGKLYTRSNKRGDTNRIKELLVYHGAEENILYETHAHVGTDKLPRIISNIRKTILDCGGEFHFNSKIVDLEIENQKIKSISDQNNTKFSGISYVFATGHSARDIYQLLHKKQIKIEAKSFAMGVRVEHQQKTIDAIQYHCKIKDINLPAATYSLVNQVKDRGVYSFCMCPGGTIVPATTNNGEIVVNGMSNSQRNSEFANSGIVTEIKLDDIKEYIEKYGDLGGLMFQQEVEKLAFQNANSGLKAPAQTVEDFVNKRKSVKLPETSYNPGVVSSEIHKWLPKFIAESLREGFIKFNQKMNGFVSNQALIIGVESRTSSPVRIPRDKESLQHIEISNLYPCGEGAGYAGGIVSSAMDGENCVMKIESKLRL